MGRREIKKKAKLMADEIEIRTKGKTFSYYDADKLVLGIIRSYLKDNIFWEDWFTKGIFEMEAEFDCINPERKTALLAYEIDDMIYLTVRYKFLNLPENLKEDEYERIKNLEVTIDGINKPNKQDFDDRDICYKDDAELERQYDEE